VSLSDPVGVVAVAAAATALLALLLAVVLAVRLRRMRAAQLVVLGTAGRDDLVAHAASLEHNFRALHDRVEEIGAHLDARMEAAEARLDGAIAYRALVRYDAYGELSGHQSMTVALLDAHRNGDGALLHRAPRHGALYCKQVVDGDGELQLSPRGGGGAPRARGRGTSRTL
jgi:hypothetical protein